MPTFACPESPPHILMPVCGITARGCCGATYLWGCSARPPAERDVIPAVEPLPDAAEWHQQREGHIRQANSGHQGERASGRAGGGASLGVGLDRDLYLELGRLMRDRR